MTTTPQPTDGAIAQAFRDAYDTMGGRYELAAIYHRAIEIDAARPAQLGGGVVSDAAVLRAAQALHLHGADSFCSETAWSDLKESEVRQYTGWAKAALEALGKGGA